MDKMVRDPEAGKGQGQPDDLKTETSGEREREQACRQDKGLPSLSGVWCPGGHCSGTARGEGGVWWGRLRG